MKNYLIIGLVAFLAFACKKEPTVWSTDWNTPLINDTLFINDLVNDSTIQEDPGGFYHLGLNRTLYQMGINDIVKIDDTTIIETFTLSVPSITIAPGFSFVNSTEEHELLLGDIQLRKVILQKGVIDFVVKNPVETKTIFTVQLPGVEKDGIPFVYTFEAPPATGIGPGVTSQTLDLSGYEVDLRGVAGISFNKLQSNITVVTDPLGPSVTMTSSDVTIVEATFRDVLIDYAKGYFKYEFSDTVPSAVEALSWFNGYVEELDIYHSGVLDLPNASISFKVENGLKLGAEGLLTYLRGANSSGTQVTLSNAQIGSSFNIDPATGSWNTLTPSVKTLTFNSTNSNVVPFLENLPSHFELGYKVELNPWGNISGGWDEIFPNSRLKLNLMVDMPLMVGMDNLALRDTFNLKIEQNTNNTHIESGKFILDLDNAFPISGNVDLILLDANNNMLQTISGSAIAQSGQFGQYNATLDLFHAKSTVEFELSEQAISSLGDIEKAIIHVKMNTTNPVSGNSQQMMIPVGAYLGVKLRAEFKTKNIIH